MGVSLTTSKRGGREEEGIPLGLEKSLVIADTRISVSEMHGLEGPCEIIAMMPTVGFGRFWKRPFVTEEAPLSDPLAWSKRNHRHFPKAFREIVRTIQVGRRCRSNRRKALAMIYQNTWECIFSYLDASDWNSYPAGGLPSGRTGDEFRFAVRPLPADVEKLFSHERYETFIQIPSRDIHGRLGFPKPHVTGPLWWSDVLLTLTPKGAMSFHLGDLADGAYRIFVIPFRQGGARCVVTTEPSMIRALRDDQLTGLLNRGGQRPPRYGGVNDTFTRVGTVLHEAVSFPPIGEWPTSTALQQGVRANSTAGGLLRLFPHQEASVRWMRQLEESWTTQSEVSWGTVRFAGHTFGSYHKVKLPSGGAIAHPPGAGKSRIVLQMHLSSSSPVPTLVFCPAHLVAQWRAEAEAAGLQCATRPLGRGGSCVEATSPRTAPFLVAGFAAAQSVLEAGSKFRSEAHLGRELRASSTASTWVLSRRRRVCTKL